MYIYKMEIFRKIFPPKNSHSDLSHGALLKKAEHSPGNLRKKMKLERDIQSAVSTRDKFYVDLETKLNYPILST